MTNPDPQPPPDAKERMVSAFMRDDIAEAERLAFSLLAREVDIDAFNILGLIEHRRGRPANARPWFMRALMAAPQSAPPALNLALVFHVFSQKEQARAWSRRARHMDSTLADAYATEASVERQMGRQPVALVLLRRALALAPQVSEFHANTGNLMLDGENQAAARIMFRRVLAAAPGHGTARFELACLELASGKLETGWREYEARFAPPALIRRRPFPQPLWSGDPVDSVLITAEQGLGDEIIFAALLPDAQNRAGSVIVECDPRLLPIFQRSFPTMQIRARQTPPDPALLSPAIARQASMGSLPGLLWPTIAQGRRSVPYLQPHPDRAAGARKWLAGLDAGPKIGIAWRSGHAYRDPTAVRLSTALADWDPILVTPDATFVNLQYGDRNEEIDAAERRTGVRVHCMPGLDLFNDLEGTLALSASVDLMISMPVTPYTLPGAAGVQIWLLRFESDYFSMGRRDAYAWLPSVRSFTRRSGEPWAGTIAEVATELRAWIRRQLPAAAGNAGR